MNRRSESHVAAIIICMFIEFGKPRMRLSKSALKAVGRRKNLRVAFVESVRDHMESWGLALIEMDDGFCVIQFSSLRGVAPYTYKRFRSRTLLDLQDENLLWEHVDENLNGEVEDDE